MGLLFIKCPDCGTRNSQEEHCTSCGAVLNAVLRRRQEDEQRKKRLKADKPIMKQSRADKAVIWFQTHPNGMVRFIFTVLNGIWLFCAMVVGGLIAAVIGIAAG